MNDVASSSEIADRARAELADLIDLQMSQLGLAAMDALRPQLDEVILDVGCGAGETICQLADRVGPSGRIVGVDIAPGVLGVAKSRTMHYSQVTLLQENAEILALPDASFDAAYSRFGVMFFDDPVSAFRNLRRLLRNSGRIAFVCWRSLDQNELDRLPLEAAGLTIAANPAPFSFADDKVIETALRSAGFSAISIEARDEQVSCGGVDATLKVVTRVGALGKILRENVALQAAAVPRVRDALAARLEDGLVHLRAAIWVVTAKAE